MSRAALAWLRPVCAALAVVLAVPVLQPNGAAAQTTPLTKIVCNLSRGGCGTNIGAFPGDTVQYQLSYRNVGNAGTVTIYDQVQPGQTYQTCSSPGGSCTFSNTPPPPQVTFTTGTVPVGGTGTVTFNATVTATSGVISDQATAVFPGTSAFPSNTVGVNVLSTGGTGGGTGGGGGTPAAGLSVAKQVRDVTTGSGYATSITVNPGDTVQYQITVTNSGTTTATAVAVSDTLQGGQSFVTTSCSTPCTFNGSTVSFGLGNIAGATSATATFNAVIGPIRGTTGQVIPNTAAAAGTNTGTATSNSTFVTIGTVTNPSTSPVTNPCPYTCGVPCQYYCGSPCTYSCGTPCGACTSGCGYPYYTCGSGCGSYYYGCYGGYPGPFCGSAYCSGPYCPTYYCATPSCPPYCGSSSFTPPYCSTPYYASYCGGPAFTGTTTVCGVVSAYTAPGTTNGTMTMNGITYTIAAGVIPTGVTIATGGYFCVTMTVSTAGLITSLVCAPNVAATSYVCGTMYPYTGINYPYSPYPGYDPPATGASYGPYPVQSSYGYNLYGWSGPLMVGGYPYPVAAGTYFPYSPAYGNPYCFVTNPTGYVTGSLSVVPTAATAVQDPPHATRVGKGFEN